MAHVCQRERPLASLVKVGKMRPSPPNPPSAISRLADLPGRGIPMAQESVPTFRPLTVGGNEQREVNAPCQCS
jgi:hypothetical protein